MPLELLQVIELLARTVEVAQGISMLRGEVAVSSRPKVVLEFRSSHEPTHRGRIVQMLSALRPALAMAAQVPSGAPGVRFSTVETANFSHASYTLTGLVKSAPDVSPAERRGVSELSLAMQRASASLYDRSLTPLDASRLHEAANLAAFLLNLPHEG